MIPWKRCSPLFWYVFQEFQRNILLKVIYLQVYTIQPSWFADVGSKATLIDDATKKHLVPKKTQLKVLIYLFHLSFSLSWNYPIIVISVYNI